MNHVPQSRTENGTIMIQIRRDLIRDLFKLHMVQKFNVYLPERNHGEKASKTNDEKKTNHPP